MEGDGEKKKFDPDLSPKSDHNKDAARQRGLTYDEKRGVYRDKDGALDLDRFGQPL